MAETEEEERDAKRNANHVTMDTISNMSMIQPTLKLSPIVLKNHLPFHHHKERLQT